MSYLSGSLVRETGSFFDITGAPADPTAISLLYAVNGGATTTLTYAASQIIKDSVGVYHHDFDTTGIAVDSVYVLEWIGTGAVQAINTDTFSVNPAPL
jgi:hypothetical protein